MRIERSDVISRPVSEVSAFYTGDHREIPQRPDPIVHLRPATEGAVGLGTIFNRCHTHFGDRSPLGLN